MDFFKECVNLKKSVLELFLQASLVIFLIEDLVTLGNLLLIEFMKPQKKIIYNSRMASLSATWTK